MKTIGGIKKYKLRCIYLFLTAKMLKIMLHRLNVTINQRNDRKMSALPTDYIKLNMTHMDNIFY